MAIVLLELVGASHARTRLTFLAPSIDIPDTLMGTPFGAITLLVPNMETATTRVTPSSSTTWVKSTSQPPKMAIDQTFFPGRQGPCPSFDTPKIARLFIGCTLLHRFTRWSRSPCGVLPSMVDPVSPPVNTGPQPRNPTLPFLSSRSLPLGRPLPPGGFPAGRGKRRPRRPGNGPGPASSSPLPGRPLS